MRRAARYGSGRRARSVYARASLQTAAPPQWIVGTRSFIEGSADTANLQPSGPLNYTQGGIYDVDSSGDALPAGMTLSDAGVLFVGSAAASSVAGVVFGYNEPGALPILTLHPGATGTLPYMATVFPLEGAVPAGMTLISTDDATLRGTVLSAWEGGSAKVVVVAGHTALTSGVTATVRVKPGLPQGTALTTATITAALASVSTNFGTPQTLSSFASPDRIWWANAQVICAQYRLAIGLGVMEAIIVVHAFAGGRCFIEVLIENGKLDANAANSNSPLIATQTYSGATVSVTPTGGAATPITAAGGVTTLAAGATAPRSRMEQAVLTYTVGGHECGRAWYVAGWTNGTAASVEGGAADPLIEVTHNTLSLQSHPWFFKPATPSTDNLTTKYAQSYDTYVPWAACRLRMPSMQKGGDSEQISLFTGNQSDYIISGSKYARKAVLATGLAMATSAIHYRHLDGTVPTKAQAVTKVSTSGGTWPRTVTEPKYAISDSNLAGDSSHSPAIALVPFLCRPSPVFIEQAWKEEILYCTGSGHGADGQYSFSQSRQHWWRNRSLGIATFLTPDADATRKAGLRATMVAELGLMQNLTGAPGSPWNTYGHCPADIWNPARTNPSPAPNYNVNTDGDHDLATPLKPGWQTSFFMHSFGAMALHAVASAKVLTGADQTLQNTVADRVAGVFVQWINGLPAGDHSWRILPYQPTIGWPITPYPGYPSSASALDNHGLTWTALAQEEMTGVKPTNAGGFQFWSEAATDWSGIGSIESFAGTTMGISAFGANFHTGITAAVERDLPGAALAWAKLYGTNGTDGTINNYNTWITGLGKDPKFNHKARNL